MGIFDEALANIGSGTVECRWDQADHGCGNGVCATVVTRWMKYKLAGNPNFWNLMQGGEEGAGLQMVRTKEVVLSKWKRIKSSQNNYSQVSARTKGGVEHFSGTYAFNRLTGRQNAFGTRAPRVSRKLKEQFSTLGYASTAPVAIGQIGDLLNEVCALPGRASYISLTQRSLASLTGHALGLYCGENRKVWFFDPNMGEVSFANPVDFKNWFHSHYQTKWHQVNQLNNYAFFNEARATSIAGLVGLKAAEKTATWIRELVKLVDEEDVLSDAFWDTEPDTGNSQEAKQDFWELMKTSKTLGKSQDFDDLIVPEFEL